MPLNTPSHPFERADLERAKRTVLRDGHWANARVERIELDGRDWTVKDFSPRSWLVRNTSGRFLLRHELRALLRLQGIRGISSDAFRLDAHAIAMRFLPGSTVHNERGRITPEFLERLEQLLQEVHGRGIVHLDTRGKGNLLMLSDGMPGIIDFEASLSTRGMPAFVRRMLEEVDLSGIYKKWLAWHPQSMTPSRRAVYERISRLRRFWVLRDWTRIFKGRRRTINGSEK